MRVARLALGCVGDDSVAGITERGCDIHPRRVGQLAARQGGSNVPVIAYGRGVLTVLMLLALLWLGWENRRDEAMVAKAERTKRSLPKNPT